MFKTIEDEVLKKAAPVALQREFEQYHFERQQRFCLLIYIASIVIWLVFDLIVSFMGGQRFTYLSPLFLGALSVLAIILGFTRKARHFHRLNVLFVLIMTLGIRMVIYGLPVTLQPAWLVLAASSILYGASVLPLSRGSFYGALLITWLILNPFYDTDIELFDLKGTMTACYSVFLSALTLYTFLKLRQARLYAYIMSKLLLDQAYLDTLTEIPNRRAFMTTATKQLQTRPREHDHYLAMIDIDNFKKVNDTYGHDIGDLVLKRIAADIKAVMADFQYARLGGEEFAVYLSGVRRGDVEHLAARLCRVVRENPGEHPVTISIGLARVADGDSLSQALRKADEALYQAKHSGKDRYTFAA
ncbi:GGDEF domain-containing protein [Pseudomonas sp. RA_35y_Pfl2_P32]|uniref:GGDEF domain-containing protein n=1 Tax=Pseudomonas sp. RA_35y_Pfl2_P32 TaxID=3088705 RepID=UPI0030DCEF53